ncbi:hypothetical protein ABZ470_31795 [Streptosporangium sp. NPDC020072]|uniref:hypothetical protein n=1 Tax=Streptosporangium sp. NPDC020072 TaxID=3154788 RepID=UPI00341AF827
MLSVAWTAIRRRIRGKEITLREGRNLVELDEDGYTKDSCAYYHVYADGRRVANVVFVFKPCRVDDVWFFWQARLYWVFAGQSFDTCDFDLCIDEAEFRTRVEAFIYRLSLGNAGWPYVPPKWEKK